MLAFVHSAHKVPYDAPDDPAGVVTNVTGASIDDLARAIREGHELIFVDGSYNGCHGVGDPF